jgi:hypothetical protein
MNNNESKNVRVWVEGYEFYVTDVCFTDKPGVRHFTGILTENPINDRLRHTSYNGGRYSLR